MPSSTKLPVEKKKIMSRYSWGCLSEKTTPKLLETNTKSKTKAEEKEKDSRNKKKQKTEAKKKEKDSKQTRKQNKNKSFKKIKEIQTYLKGLKRLCLIFIRFFV